MNHSTSFVGGAWDEFLEYQAVLYPYFLSKSSANFCQSMLTQGCRAHRFDAPGIWCTRLRPQRRRGQEKFVWNIAFQGPTHLKNESQVKTEIFDLFHCKCRCRWMPRHLLCRDWKLSMPLLVVIGRKACKSSPRRNTAICGDSCGENSNQHQDTPSLQPGWRAL